MKRSSGDQPADSAGSRLLDVIKIFVEGSGTPCKREGNALKVGEGAWNGRISLKPQSAIPPSKPPVQTVLQIRCDLPPEVAQFLREPEMRANCNRFATLGAVIEDASGVFVVARVSVFEGEDATFGYHAPMAMMASMSAGHSLAAGAAQAMKREAGRSGESSAWGAEDFKAAAAKLKQVCACTASDDGLTAEFALGGGAGSAVAGDNETALLQIDSGVGHPEVGGGLLVRLTMPYAASSDAELVQMVEHLNQAEFAANDTPPFFGAWCVGNHRCPAYVSFLENDLNMLEGILLQQVAWAHARAEWAAGVLRGMRGAR